MSGDVQPRKRKDKKKNKKDEAVDIIHEPKFESRGTAAALGEGDIFMHSYSDHGTGGHWCAKIIFFSLLAVLVTLIGLIIMENRGLSELEANAVESRYSGVLEGWLEDAPGDDHHDEHTLELTHHDDHDDDEEEDLDHVLEEDDEHDSGYDDEVNEDQQNHEDDSQEDDIEEQSIEQAVEVQEEGYFSKFFGLSSKSQVDESDDNVDESQNDDDNLSQENDGDEDNDDDNLSQENEGNEDLVDDNLSQENEGDEDNDVDNLSQENDGDEDNDDQQNYYNEEQNDDGQDDNLSADDFNEIDNKDESQDKGHRYNNYYGGVEKIDDFFDGDNDEDDTFANDKEDDKEHDDDDDHEEEDEEVEVERIEKEAEDEEPISVNLPALPENDDDDNDKDDDDDKDTPDDDDEHDNDDGVDDDDDFLDADPPPVVERITAPAGKPFKEMDDEDSSERPPDMLEEEEEYEKKQEELRREQEQVSSHIWMKLAIGGALLAATFGLISRATAPRDIPELEDDGSREGTPVIDRRMTLIPEEPETPKSHVVPKKAFEAKQSVAQEAAKAKPISFVTRKTPRVVKQQVEEEEPEDLEPEEDKKDDPELYSDEEEEEEMVEPKKEIAKKVEPVEREPTPEDDEDVPDDVEIINENFEEEEDEEEISDVDDVELLSRLEAKYGRLPEPERPEMKHKDGGNSVEEWPGEPSDPFWRQQLDAAERELRQGEYKSAVDKASAPELSSSARARWLAAAALDKYAETERDNRFLSRAIASYLELLKMNERLTDKKLIEITNRTLDRIQFRGTYLTAEPVYRLLMRRFPADISYRHGLTITYLMSDKTDLAEAHLKTTLQQWPNDRLSLAQYAFLLKTKNKLEEAVELFQKALEGDEGPGCEPRFYYHYGDALLLLGRFKEANEVHERGAKYGHFLSAAQRSLYNIPRLKSQPWWNVNETPYINLAKSLERNWQEILQEGSAAKAYYEQEKEGLRERGKWSQLDLYARGREIPGKCQRAPVTCAVVKTEAGAVGCRRGQIKFSSMEPGTHVRPHVGPTNCRLRMHLGLSNTKDTYIRVGKETRQWREGKVLMFDDSFEHEVWHNGTGARLVLIVDVWHPQLTADEKRALPAI